jgi:hypothetical protein
MKHWDFGDLGLGDIFALIFCMRGRPRAKRLVIGVRGLRMVGVFHLFS